MPRMADRFRCASRAGVIGAVTVSGLRQRDDHQFVVETLCAVLGADFSALTLGHA